MRVAELWRYPVKSLAGERLAAVMLAAGGVDGDRAWGILDRGDGRILTGRREPRLLFAASRLGPDGFPRVTLPDGRELAGLGPATDAALSAWLGKPVTLVAAAESDAARAEYFEDATDDTSRAIEWTMPRGRFVDGYPVLVMTTAGLRSGTAAHAAGAWDVRRFRPNVLIELDGEDWLEDAWLGRVLHAGSAEIAPRRPCIRCTMVTRAQPGLAKDVDIYKAVCRTHGGHAGVWSEVAQPGSLAEGDAVELV
ncbi:MAG: MOSC N-terminal beta barrel domain-containing protein [bacterium]